MDNHEIFERFTIGMFAHALSFVPSEWFHGESNERMHFNDSASRLHGHDLAPESLPHHDPPQISTCLTGGRLNSASSF